MSTNPDRPSFDTLMEAKDALMRAFQIEQEAGNTARAMEINNIVLLTFIAAIRDEDLVLP